MNTLSIAKQTTLEASVSKLEELYAMRDQIAMNKRAQRDQIIPEEVKRELESLEAEYSLKEERLAENIMTVESLLKEQAIERRETIQGSLLQVVFTRGGYSVSAKDLLALAGRWEKTNPEVAAEMKSIITPKKSSASIKARGA